MLNKLKKEIKLKRDFIIKTIYMYLLRDLGAQTDISSNWYQLEEYIAWKVSVFGVILVRILENLN